MIPGLLRHFRPGDTERTAFSAAVMNEFVDALNMFLRARPGVGLKLYFADGGLRIELDDFLQKRLALTGDGQGGQGVKDGQGPGPLRWMGEWNSNTDYLKNDIVIHRTSAAINSGDRAGTFIAAADNKNVEPQEASVASQTTWRTLAKGAWDKLVIFDSFTGRSISLDGSAGAITADTVKGFVAVTSDASMKASTGINLGDGTPQQMQLSASEVTPGKQVKFRTITYITSVNFFSETTQSETRIFACSETL